MVTELHDPGSFATLVHHLQGIRVGGEPLSALGRKNCRIESAEEDGLYAEATLTGPHVVAVGLSKAKRTHCHDLAGPRIPKAAPLKPQVGWDPAWGFRMVQRVLSRSTGSHSSASAFVPSSVRAVRRISGPGRVR